MRSCNQYKTILVNNSKKAIVNAKFATPVISQDNKNVSRLPVMRQVTAFNKDL